MNVTDYLIDPSDKDWPRLLAPWIPPLPAAFNVWLVNRLGEVFALDADGAVLRLDVGVGTCERVAPSQQEFARLLDSGAAARTWLRIAETDACRAAGMQLGPFECYGFRIPPTLGGAWLPPNLVPTNLAVHYSYQAYIIRQQDIYWIPPD